LQKYIPRNKHAYIIINVSYKGIYVELERKKHNIGVPTFMTDLLNIIFDYFGISLLG